jgi:hypothetical protein
VKVTDATVKLPVVYYRRPAQPLIQIAVPKRGRGRKRSRGTGDTKK